MPWYPAEQWIDICPWRNIPLEIKPVPPPIKHMKHVKDMAKGRKSISRIDAHRPRTAINTAQQWK